MKGQRQGVRSVKPKSIREETEQDANAMSILTSAAKQKQKDVYVKIWDTQEKVYTDQTGRLPWQSYKGNRYVMVLVEVDSNYIDAEPMKNRTEQEII